MENTTNKGNGILRWLGDRLGVLERRITIAELEAYRAWCNREETEELNYEQD